MKVKDCIGEGPGKKGLREDNGDRRKTKYPFSSVDSRVDDTCRCHMMGMTREGRGRWGGAKRW